MNNIQKYNAFYLASIPFLGIYKLPIGISLDWIMVLVLFILNMCHYKLVSCMRIRVNEVRWFKSIFIISILGFIVNCMNGYFNISLFVNNFVALFIFFIALIVITSSCDIKSFVKYLYFFGTLASLVCIFQRIQLLLTGSFMVDFFIPGLVINRDIDTFDLTRVSAFFTEPAHLAIYLLPIFYIALNQGRTLFYMIFAGGIIFSGSSTGLLMLILLSVIFMVKSNVKKIYLVLALLFSITIIFLVIFFFPDVLMENVEKITNTNMQSTRLLGPLNYFCFFNFLQFLFGVGFNQLADFLTMNGVYLENEWGVVINANYANAFLYMTLSYGLIGFFFFIKYLKKLVYKNSCDVGILVFSLGILLSDQILFNRNLLYLLSLLLFSKYIIIKSKSV